eukprot:GHRR01027624.1.p1 GENE.GHRR01027624.1~~GHRR01027624.1.p1  ORF type:complete len:377 (+),score=217.32 GHRR01027624.1:166-1296(+)
MASVCSIERPRKLSIPAPYAASKPSVSGREDTVRALRDKLSDFKSENLLLGSLVKNLKAERDGLCKKLAVTSKQLEMCNSKATDAAAQANAAVKDQQRLQAEVDRLSAIVHAHSVRLQKSKQHQQELEDVALDLRQELDKAQQAQRESYKTAQQAQHAQQAAEAKLMAAGLGQMPKMGPTAEQLIINSAQRIRELTDELTVLKQESQQVSALQEQLQQQEQHWEQEVQAAQAAAQEAAATTQKQHQQQEVQIQQHIGRLAESEQHCRQLQEVLVGLQNKAAEQQTMAQAQAELQVLKQEMLHQSHSVQQQVLQLQGQLANAELQQAAALTKLQQQAQELQQQLVTAQREKQELAGRCTANRHPCIVMPKVVQHAMQ